MRSFTRRVAVVCAVAVGLSLGLPSGAVPSGGGFPLAWLVTLFGQPAAWARAYVGELPVQPHGSALGLSGYVAADATRAHQGAGSAPHKAAGGLDGYVPHDAGSPQTVTLPGPRGFNPQTSTRDAARSGAAMDYFVNADGSVTKRLYAGRNNYRAADGTWQPIDTRLVRDTHGRWRMAANSLDVSLAGGASGQGGGWVPDLVATETTHLVSMTLPGGQVAAYDLQDASLTAPVVDGSKATYGSVLPHTDLVLETLADEVKETLVLSSPDAPSSWVFPLALQGLTPRLTPDGSVELRNDSGTPVGWFPRGSMHDSHFDPQTGDMTHSAGITFELTTLNGAPALRVTADSAWLQNAARVYPVSVDPTLTLGINGDVYVDNDSSTGSAEQNGNNVAIGTYDWGTTKARGFLSFTDFSAAVGGNRITNAQLDLFLTWTYSCVTHRPFFVRRVTQSWTVPDLAVSSYPGPTIDNTDVGSLTVTDPGSACTNTGGDRSVGKWVYVPLNVATFNDWSSGGSNFGLAVIADEGDSYGWKRFTAANYNSGAYKARMELTYTPNIPPQIDTRYPGNNAIVDTLTPQLVSRAHDPDTFPDKGLTYSYGVKDSTGATVASSGWVPTPGWTVPSGALKWNGTYTYSVQVSDGVGPSVVYPEYAFATPVPQPTLTSNLAQNPGKGYDPNTGNYTTSAIDVQVAGVGPALAVSRSYNSLDLRRRGAFGQGWSSIVDTQAAETTNAAGALQTVVVTYPTGQDIAFGRNADGSFTAPSGRFATLTATMSGGTVTGYRLTDKDATVYAFGRSAGGGVYRITSITDANGRTLSFTYDATTGLLSTMTSASGRSLTFTWAATPTNNIGVQHVATVTTDPPTTGGTGYTWTYSYTSYDRLTTVCPPGTTTECTVYGWGNWANEYANAALDSGPYSYWRLNEAAGAGSARSAVLTNAGVDNGVYHNVTLGMTPALTDSGSTAASFSSGSSSYVQLPGKLIADGSYQSISMWFKTTTPGGVLFSYSHDPITAGTTATNYTPALYIDSNGYLRGEFWQNAVNPMRSLSTVTNGAWHHVVLAGAGNTQTMYLDGVTQASLSGTIALYQNDGSAYEYVGAGFVGLPWPNHTNSNSVPAVANYFTGQISDVAFFNKALTAPAVSSLYWVGQNSSSLMSTVTRPTGRRTAQVAVSNVTGRVTGVTDDNGGTWTMGTPSVVGDSDVYEAAVLGSKPQDYWRLQDPAGTVDAVDEVNGGVATYGGQLTFGSAGPFADSKSVTFNGSSSYLQLPSADIPPATAAPSSIGVWFKTTSTAGGVLVGYESNVIGAGGDTNWVPALYVGTDGKLRGTYCYCGGSPPITSTTNVNNGAWHFAVLTQSTTGQALYLDGAQVGVKTIPSTESRSLNYGYVGAGTIAYWPSNPTNTAGYFTGSIGEVAYFGAQLSAADVQAQYDASVHTTPVALTVVDTTVQTISMPVKVVTVTDPGGRTISYSYDLLNGGRMVAQTDALGNTTRYGYDTGGFSNLLYDPNGVRAQTVQDARGNAIQQITCQDQSTSRCSTVYYEYYLNTSNPTDPRNDLITSIRDARSASATDNTYKTTYAYDAAGNPTTVTGPLARATTTSYTDGTTVAAYDSGFAPAGLPASIARGSASQTVTYYANGDVARVVTPAGKTTTFTYDKLGRKLTETDVTDTFPSGRTTSYTYDALGRVLTQTDPPVTNRVTGAVHTPVTTNVYDADGDMTSQTTADTTGGDVARTQTVTFNTYGQKESQTDALSHVTSFTYDAYGHVVIETDADGGQTRYDVDAEGNVLKVWALAYTGDPNNPSAPTDTVLVSRQYDPAGRLATETDAMGWTTSYTYTDNGLPVAVTRSDGTNSFIMEQTGYDAAGNVVSKTTSNGATTTAYAYDAASRPYRSTLDPAGLNRVTDTVLSEDDNVVSTTSRVGTGASLAESRSIYDPEGRLLEQTGYNSDASVTPVARWRLNETSGASAADSIGVSRAAVTGNVVWTGSAAQFDGSASYLKTDDPVVDTSQSFTMSAWVRLADKSGDRAVLWKPSAGASPFYLIYEQSTDKWLASMAPVSTSGTYTSVRSTSTAQSGVDTHLSAVYDASTGTFSLYVNGALQGSATGIRNRQDVRGSVYIGRYSGSYWSGTIRDVQVYQSALSGSQLGAVYAGTAPAAGAGIARTWYGVDNDGLVLSSTDPNGNRTDISYDEADRAAVMTGAPVSAETVSGTVTARPVSYVGYDTFGDKTETVDGNGNRTVHVFDRAGREYETHLPSYTPPGGGAAISPVVSRTFDALGQVATSTDARGKVTTYVYDQLGRLASATAPNTGVTRATYDMLGHQLSSTDPTGAVSGATYDYLGRRLTSSQVVRQSSATYTTTYAYNSAGRLGQVTSPRNVTQVYTYNPAGEPLTSTDGAGLVTSYAYDGLGRTVRVTQPDNTYATTTYDMLGRATASAAYAAAGGTPLAATSRGYDGAGNVTSSTDARGTTTTFTYDPTGMVLSENQPISSTDAIGTSFGYDLAGNRTRFTDGRGNAFWTTYNVWNLPESQIEPSTAAHPNLVDRTFTTTYDAAGHPVSQLLPGGVSQAYGYNDVGQIVSQTGAGAETATSDRTFGYDLAGRMTSFSGSAGTTTVGYDDRGLPLSITGASGNSSFGYNADGAVASRTDAAGTTTYDYDAAGRLVAATNSGAGVAATYAYNGFSGLSMITYGGTGNTRTFSYDDMHRVTRDELRTSGGTSISRLDYGWDANGNETSKTTTNFNGTTTANVYTYDLADRLVSWDNGSTTVGYAYDKSGNRTQNGSSTFSYDARNRLINDSQSTYTYTARGTLSTVTTGATAVHTVADAFGQVVSQEAGTATQAYTYDGLGRVVRPGFSYTGLGNTLAGDGTATYVRGAGDELLGEVAGGVQRLVWTDLHSDVVGQFTPTGTALAGSVTYDPLGKVLATAGMLGNLGYQSEWTDGLTGRVNMLARWYNTATGQFDTRDTVANNPVPRSVDANRYQYGDANPLTVTDPTGHSGWDWIRHQARRLGNGAQRLASAGWNVVTAGARWMSDTVSAAEQRAEDRFERLRRWGGEQLHRVATVVDQGRKYVAHKVQAVKQQVKRVVRQVHQAGRVLQARATRAVSKAVKDVRDAAHATAKWVKEHKEAIIEVVAVVATIAATVALGPVGGILVGIAINVAKDAALGHIHSLADLGKSVLVGGVTGVLGAVTGGVGGVIGGKIAGAIAGKFAGNVLGRVTAGAVGGAIGGAATDVGTQLATRGRVDWRETAMAAGTGAIIGGISGGFARSRATGGREEEAAPARRSPGCETHSFDPATRVLMANGSTKPIKDVRLGDKVAATDPATGRTEAKQVTALHHNQDADLADVTVADTRTGTTTVLHTTWHHPFWNADAQRFDDARNLKPGTHLRDAHGKTTQIVVAIKIWTGLHWMRDLTVADIHTYYVIAGTTPVLVHNNDQCEVFYRGMGEKEFAGLGPNGEISPRGENFVTQSRDYVTSLRDRFLARGGRSAQQYTRLVRYEMAPGTSDALISAGRGSGDNIAAIQNNFGISLDEIGADTNYVHVKMERGGLNFGLRSGSAQVFNSRIQSFSEVPWGSDE